MSAPGFALRVAMGHEPSARASASGVAHGPCHAASYGAGMLNSGFATPGDTLWAPYARMEEVEEVEGSEPVSPHVGMTFTTEGREYEVLAIVYSNGRKFIVLTGAVSYPSIYAWDIAKASDWWPKTKTKVTKTRRWLPVALPPVPG